MKLNILFSSLLLMSICRYVEAMDKKKDAYLKFKLDKELRIIDHKAKNMTFFCAPEEFEGVIITEAIPLEPHDLALLTSGFQKAFVYKKKQKVEYTLEDKQFVAAIKNRSSKEGFSVKVKEVDPAKKK